MTTGTPFAAHSSATRLRDFAANSFINLLIALAILVWSLARYPEPLSIDRIALFGFLLLLGVFLGYVLNFLFLVPVFWLHNASGFPAGPTASSRAGSAGS